MPSEPSTPHAPTAKHKPSSKSRSIFSGAGVPIFMGHGTQDPMVRPEWGEVSRRSLVAGGYPVEWHTYPMPHAVVWEEIVAIAAFLGRVLRPG